MTESPIIPPQPYGFAGQRLPLIIPTPSGYQFARGVADHLKNKYLKDRGFDPKTTNIWVDTNVQVFADTDRMSEILNHIRWSDVYIVADVESTATMLPSKSAYARPPSHLISMRNNGYTVEHNDYNMELDERKISLDRNFSILLSTINATRKALTKHGNLTAVLPCFPGRQDRRIRRSSLELKERIRMLEKAGVDHILTLDIHNDCTELALEDPRTGFDSLYARPTFINHLHSRGLPKNIIVISADDGAFKKTRPYAKELKTPVATMYKIREVANAVDEVGFVGDPKTLIGKHAVLVDDIIDTAGTIVADAVYLRSHGVEAVTVIATHAIFSPPALERLEDAVQKGVIHEVIVTNSITHPESVKNLPWLTTVDVTKYFAKAIDHLNSGASISALLEPEDD
jgi:ribose-phosphate pyrophosphokinase